MATVIDKENNPRMVNAMPVQTPVLGKPRGKFVSMLQEAKKEVQTEQDELYAIDIQADEVTDVVREWMQESQDAQAAEQLARALAEEDEADRRLQVLRGESEALRVAVEEKRRLKADAEAKAKREVDDALLAKKLADEEMEYTRQRQALLEADEKLCRDLEQTEKGAKGEENGQEEAESKVDHNLFSPDAKQLRNYLQDDQQDAGSDTEDEEEDEKAVEDDAKDGFPSISRAPSLETDWAVAERVVRQLEDDFEMARHFQRQLDLEYVRSKKAIEEKDAKLSRKLQLMENRKAFMARKRSHLKEFYEFSDRSEKTIATLWEKADAEVDNADSALCLTVLLPEVKELAVKLIHETVSDSSSSQRSGLFRRRSRRHHKVKKNPVIRIDASRKVKNEATAKPENSLYLAEFQLDPNANGKKGGAGLRLSMRDIYYEYSPESGLLFIFVENILLDEATYDNASSAVYTNLASGLLGNESSTSATSSGPAVAPAKSAPSAPVAGTGGSVKARMMKQIQNSFMRIFSGKQSPKAGQHGGDNKL